MTWLITAACLFYGFVIGWGLGARRARRRAVRRYLTSRITTRVFIPWAVRRQIDNKEQLTNQAVHGEQGYYE